jgi:hypothetical protein
VDTAMASALLRHPLLHPWLLTSLVLLRLRREAPGSLILLVVVHLPLHMMLLLLPIKFWWDFA